MRQNSNNINNKQQQYMTAVILGTIYTFADVIRTNEEKRCQPSTDTHHTEPSEKGKITSRIIYYLCRIIFTLYVSYLINTVFLNVSD